MNGGGSLIPARNLARIGSSFLQSFFRPTLLSTFVIPTRKCNVACSYCEQVEAQPGLMSYELYTACLDKLHSLGNATLVFTGGEPFLWSSLSQAVKDSAERGMFTGVVTNGILANEAKIDELVRNGLGYLHFSIDGVKRYPHSPKTLENTPKLLGLIDHARYKRGLNVSCNAVLTSDNVDNVVSLAHVLTGMRIPLSVGIAERVGEHEGDEKVYLSNHRDLLPEVMHKLVRAKHNGCMIIEPEEYFLSYKRHLSGEDIWRCKKPNSRSLAISPEGEVLICTRLNRSLGHIGSFDRGRISSSKAVISNEIQGCNPNCYANCAFNNFYYQKHPFRFLVDVYRNY